ncbi:sporulation protein [Amycolatopsis umgeniensis]|uniref:Putative spore protein YtfJ n=1 Tax=Amycolatopsis umgeniensis TaxID=336628 RepID=A0A841ANR4_9PSEU|nr:sporulation protein [Amycolatopsis umgeniensis]MBB5850389.1 putative spore protein YtfJ [Amycolatopsis umgeniensis]
MGLEKIVGVMRDNLTVRRVYGEPVEKDGVVVIPAASVIGGGGGGHGSEQEKEGEGGGFIVAARPVGAYVLKGGDVRWVPAVDLTVLGVVFAVMVATIHKARRRR